MEEFKQELLTGNYITTVTINNFCIEMSRFVTEKTR